MSDWEVIADNENTMLTMLNRVARRGDGFTNNGTRYCIYYAGANYTTNPDGTRTMTGTYSSFVRWLPPPDVSQAFPPPNANVPAGVTIVAATTQHFA